MIESECVICGEPIEQPDTGRWRKTCSDRCRKRKQRREQLAPVRTLTIGLLRDLITKLPGPWGLDLFCGAGGCSAGYVAAGINMVGVDIEPQPNYPYPFLQADVFDFLRVGWWQGFDFIHASPPCQRYSVTCRNYGTWENHPDLVEPTRIALAETGLPFVIENVPGAPLIEPVMLCGSSLGLDLRRHRLFEPGGGLSLVTPPCSHGWQTPRFAPSSKRTNPARVVMLHGAGCDVKLWRRAMGIPWMTRDELTQAIPPAYTELLGGQIVKQIRRQGLAVPGIPASRVRSAPTLTPA